MLALAGALCLAALAAGPVGAVTISSPGPVTAIALGADLSCQVSWINDVDYEFYPPRTTPGDCGTFLAVGDTLYAPDFRAHGSSATAGLGGYVPFDPVSQTGVLGSGTSVDPYRVRTVVDAPGANLRVTEETTYVAGSQTYRIETSVEGLPGAADTTSAILYHAGDCYASGSDIGFGFTRPEIRSVGCSQSPDNVPAGRTIQLAPLSEGSHHYEAFYRQVWERIATKTQFPDTCRCGEHVDNGAGLSWALAVPRGARQTRGLTVSFTETTPPAPPADSDGDALPDAWETGAAPSGDYENLATLGADPLRKDVFVHADWVQGCAPPAGWEREAIEVFRAHGIALHVDSGSRSLNHDLQPWGTRSRAGELPPAAELTIWGEPFDTLKDRWLVPSARRRAFHYAVFARRIAGTGASGQSRGIGDADFVVATCGATSDGVDPGRWTTITFVHELGHNLGLAHGGGDHVNGKPNYYSIMNYFWGWFGGVKLPRRLVPAGSANSNRPNLSESVRPPIDENAVHERDLVVLPVAWSCPNGAVRYWFGQGADRVDWNCNGVWGEDERRLNLNGDENADGTPIYGQLAGFDDWRALRFDGGSVLGDFDVPPRPNPPLEPEPTVEDVTRTAREVARAVRQQRRQLRVHVGRRRLGARRATTVRVRVQAGRRRIRGARIRVRGARVLKGRGERTDRRGRVTLTLRPARRGDVRILALRRGFERGGVVVPVRRRR